MNNKTLGRGLSAFLNNQSNDNADVLKIDINKIIPNPYQPRHYFDEEQLNSLALSIKKRGVLQPIIVQKISEDVYQLIAGERRFRASKLAGLETIPAILTDLNKEEQLEVAILENVQRENLNPIEEAESYHRLITEFNHTQEELADIIGKSRSHISNVIRLLNLPEEVKLMVKQGKLSFGHARTLVGTNDASKIAEKIINNNLNVRESESLVQSYKKRTPYRDPEIFNLINQLSELTGLKVDLKLKGSGGVLEMSFKDFSQLDAFIQKLNGAK